MTLANVYRKDSDFKSYTLYANEKLLKLDYEDTTKKNKTLE
ncbi:hypothetical protein ACW95P_00870 [Candidatus Mycoplasma pogonae]